MRYLHIATDVTIGMAYTAMSLAAVHVARARPDLRQNRTLIGTSSGDAPTECRIGRHVRPPVAAVIKNSVKNEAGRYTLFSQGEETHI